MALLTWLENPPADRGMRILDRDGSTWSFYSYADLALLTRRAASRLRAAGVSAGDVVVLVRRTSPEFMADFFAALLLGATPSPVAQPSVLRDRTAYLNHLDRIVRMVSPSAVATTDDVAAIIEPVVGAHGCAVVTDIPDDIAPLETRAATPEIGVIQFSSGSVGPPRGVAVPFASLQSNVSAMHTWLEITDTDSYASWLPLHHDMGLVGMFLLPIEGVSDMWLMQPEDFVRSPLRWLRCFGDNGATVTAMPAFGLAHIAGRVRQDQITELDLSRWRVAVVGAERIHAHVVRRFLDLLAPCGLRPEVVVPAYGMAESTLAVTGSPCAADLSTMTVDGRRLALGSPVHVVTGEGEGTTLVACGAPIRGVEMRVVDEDGGPVAEGTLGEIEVRGESLAAGYVREAGSIEKFGGVLRTGDAGFVRGGQLYVVGRLGDGVKRYGRWLFAEDAEQVATRVSPRPRQTVALVGSFEGRDTVAVLVEGGMEAGAEHIGRTVARHLSGLRVIVFVVPRGVVMRTTSGKPRRRAMWGRLVEGALATNLVWDSDALADGARA
ncbi:AMP-binding protein [Nonomuraea angiospora]|uniref:Acyl-CoA synthetase (AMP-forming)/AMP-acid ligase II n=1 Tax=Nonomuraea angiospora TaxID=46172 RepID=A0ABR9LPS6_9ACTN|nr:AMP-binding protein [Nonomuraea angiospora]MBE1582282.1 acyl-CoA synthetase (AMP-forming)/AMP-acid ligase II [Nonomuraea angiospora]